MPSAIHLAGSIPVFWIVFGVLAAVLFSLWTYRWTRPPVPTSLRLLLVVVRGFALASVWLLLTGFEVHWDRVEPQRPRIAVLIDQSKSMLTRDDGRERHTVALHILDRLEAGGKDSPRDLLLYGFGERLENINDENEIPAPADPATNLESAFRSLRQLPESGFDAVLLLTDGVVNAGASGETESRKLQIPVFVVGVGDSVQRKDLIIQSVMAPEAGYVGDSVAVDVNVASYGFRNEKLTVILEDQKGVVLERKETRVGGTTDVRRMTFGFVPEKPGLQTWSIAVSSITGEAETENNRRQFAIRVADRKRRIAFLSGRPDPEAAAWVQALEKDPDTRSQIVIGGGKKGEPVRGTWSAVEPDSLDGAFVLLLGSYSRDGRTTLGRLADSETPLVIETGGPDVSKTALALLDSRTGRWKPDAEMQRAELQPERQHPIFTKTGNWFEAGLQPPPVYVPPIRFLEGEELASGVEDNRTTPVVVDRTKGGPRTLLINASGVGEWGLALRPQDPEGHEFASFLNRLLRWLTLREEEGQVTLGIARNLITQGESDEAILQVNDGALRPLQGASVHATLRGSSGSQNVTFTEREKGRWSAEIRPNTSGKQILEAVVVLPDGNVVHKSIELVVDPFQLESLDVRMRVKRLRVIAAQTGGMFETADHVEDILRALPRAKGVREVHGSWRPFGETITLLLIVFALGIEWFFRTRKGMA